MNVSNPSNPLLSMLLYRPWKLSLANDYTRNPVPDPFGPSTLSVILVSCPLKCHLTTRTGGYYYSEVYTRDDQVCMASLQASKTFFSVATVSQAPSCLNRNSCIQVHMRMRGVYVLSIKGHVKYSLARSFELLHVA